MPERKKVEQDEQSFLDKNVRENLDEKSRMLYERILAREEVEDYCHELRIEPTPEVPVKYILRFYPLFWAALDNDWEKMHRLWEKGYRLFGEDMEEPTCEKYALSNNNQHILKWEVLFTEIASICFKEMIVDAVEQTDEITEWMCAFLEERVEILREKGKLKDGRILLGIRSAIRRMQDGRADSRRQEKFLDEMRKRLPKWYGLLDEAAEETDAEGTAVEEADAAGSDAEGTGG